MNNITSEISGNLLFRYRIPVQRIKTDKKSAVDLSDGFALPEFGSFDGQRSFGEIRSAWSDSGIYFTLSVSGKKQSLWCKKTQLLESDGLQIWLDTRDTHNVHRATKFCHWFVFLPEADTSQKKPLAAMLKINRAKEHSPTINQMPLSISSKVNKSGYTTSIFIPGGSINGWNTDEHRSIGFNYLISDREMGTQSLSVGADYPISEDPSLWHTLQLVD